MTTAASHEQELEFADEETSASAAPRASNLKILFVDDDEDVHLTTKHVLHDFAYQGVAPIFMYAYSAAEAVEMLKRDQSVAVVVLDVVMETDDAGLTIVKTIREDLGMSKTQILLRTGQPGMASEVNAVSGYDINGYLLKSDVTVNRLFATLTTALRAHDLLCRQEATHRAVEQLLSVSSSYLGVSSLEDYTLDVIGRAAALLGVTPKGLLLSRADSADQFLVSVATQNLADLRGKPLDAIADAALRDRLKRCLNQRKSNIDDSAATLFVSGALYSDVVMHIVRDNADAHVDLTLLEVMKNAYSAGAENISLLSDVSRMTFEDSLLGIHNRKTLVEELNRRLKSSGDAKPTLALVSLDAHCHTHSLSYADWLTLLQTCAARLKQTLPRALLARTGAQSFGLLGDAKELSATALNALRLESPTGEFAPKATSLDLDAVTVVNGEDALRQCENAGG